MKPPRSSPASPLPQPNPDPTAAIAAIARADAVGAAATAMPATEAAIYAPKALIAQLIATPNPNPFQEPRPASTSPRPPFTPATSNPAPKPPTSAKALPAPMAAVAGAVVADVVASAGAAPAK